VHDWALSVWGWLFILVQHYQIHSGVSLSIVVTPLTKRNLVATISSVFI